jgi:hypothetical protein
VRRVLAETGGQTRFGYAAEVIAALGRPGQGPPTRSGGKSKTFATRSSASSETSRRCSWSR